MARPDPILSLALFLIEGHTTSSDQQRRRVALGPAGSGRVRRGSGIHVREQICRMLGKVNGHGSP